MINRPLPPLLKFQAAALLSGLMLNPLAQAVQNANQSEPIEEIAVVGTQIKGAQINDALAVSVVDAGTIERLGIDSGDELLRLIPENGQNFFNEAGNISGGVNAARGDIGAFNLRNIGTGNTLVLLNGRRMVNAASYQTEEVGGSFVPVNTVNANVLPVGAMARVEVLRDGASAIYGADAVAGVVNNVIDTKFEGFQFRVKGADYESLSRNDSTLSLKWGTALNDDRTHLATFLSRQDRGRVSASEDARWANADLSERVSPDSPWYGNREFDGTSANSLYGQYDLLDSAASTGLRNVITDSRGEFETYPEGDPRCQFSIGYGTCGAIDGQGTYRYNLNEFRDLVSERDRTNVFVSLTHDFGNGLESFSEFGYYQSNTNLGRHPTASFSSSKLIVAADNYWNPLGPCGSPNRLPDSVIGTDVPCSGLALEIDNYRFAEYPRTVNNKGENFRVLQGFRGSLNQWDWETALVWSKDKASDITSNRVSNTLMQEALNDSTEAAYNPFSGGVNSNIERALIDVSRKSEAELRSFDVKFSTAELLSLPAGNIAALIGTEYREESFIDDRDDRLDGTISFVDADGDTFPYVSDVVNSSPTPDNSGERSVTSVFGELQIPVLENLDVQLALRYENLSDAGDTTVGKAAFGWQPIEQFMLRGSWSQAFRAPNLVTINEDIVARNNSRVDWTCIYAAENGGDPDQNIIDCENSIQRIAQGSKDLKPETSDNTSLGVVLAPLDKMTITVDFWQIQKVDTIGLLGEENHTLLDLYYRLESGANECNTDPAVVRGDVTPEAEAVYLAAGICPAGDLIYIDDRYANLDKRTTQGYDIGLYYNLDTSIGMFSLRYNGSFLTKFEQKAGGDAKILVDAQNSGILPPNYPVTGFDDLIGKDGNQDQRHFASVDWDYNGFGASLSAVRIGDFYQSELTLEDGTRYVIPAMTTYDASVDYRFDYLDSNFRIRVGAKNLTDERAPLAATSFGFFNDAHSDLGRSYYVDLKASF